MRYSADWMALALLQSHLCLARRRAETTDSLLQIHIWDWAAVQQNISSVLNQDRIIRYYGTVPVQQYVDCAKRRCSRRVQKKAIAALSLFCCCTRKHWCIPHSSLVRTRSGTADRLSLFVQLFFFILRYQTCTRQIDAYIPSCVCRQRETAMLIVREASRFFYHFIFVVLQADCTANCCHPLHPL